MSREPRDDSDIIAMLRWSLIMIVAWVLIIAGICAAHAGEAIWVQVTIWHPTEGPQQTACIAREGLGYTWNQATGFTLSGGCWPFGDTLFADGFEP